MRILEASIGFLGNWRSGGGVLVQRKRSCAVESVFFRSPLAVKFDRVTDRHGEENCFLAR
jgi:hypothetical protein